MVQDCVIVAFSISSGQQYLQSPVEDLAEFHLTGWKPVPDASLSLQLTLNVSHLGQAGTGAHGGSLLELPPSPTMKVG